LYSYLIVENIWWQRSRLASVKEG